MQDQLHALLHQLWSDREALICADQRITGSADHIRIGGVVEGWDVVRKDDGAWVVSSRRATYVLPGSNNGPLRAMLELLFLEVTKRCNDRLGTPAGPNVGSIAQDDYPPG